MDQKNDDIDALINFVKDTDEIMQGFADDLAQVNAQQEPEEPNTPARDANGYRDWMQGLRDDLDLIEHRIQQLVAQGVPEDDPRMVWMQQELDHFIQMAERMAADK
jgi:hypothetical protein